MSRETILRAAVAIGMLALLTACSSHETSSPTSASAAAASVSVSGTAPGMGQTAQFSAIAKFPNSNVQDVTLLATWSSSNPSIATVSSSGVVAVLRDGDADVIATYQGVSGKSRIAVPIYSGIWTGTYTVDRCTSIDPPGLLLLALCSSIYPQHRFKFTLSQSGPVVTGTYTVLDLEFGYQWRCGTHGCAGEGNDNLAMSGTTAQDDTLSITAAGPVNGFQGSMTFILRRASPNTLAGTIDGILSLSGITRATLSGTLTSP